jgi:hypothetical protein
MVLRVILWKSSPPQPKKARQGGPPVVWGAGLEGCGRHHSSTCNLIFSKAAARKTNRYVYNGIVGNFVEKLAPTAKKSTSRAVVIIELEKNYFFGSTLVKDYPFGWYLGFSGSKSKFGSPTKGTLRLISSSKSSLGLKSSTKGKLSHSKSPKILRSPARYGSGPCNRT